MGGNRLVAAESCQVPGVEADGAPTQPRPGSVVWLKLSRLVLGWNQGRRAGSCCPLSRWEITVVPRWDGWNGRAGFRAAPDLSHF